VLFQCGDGVDQMAKTSPQPIQSPDNQRIPFPQVADRLSKTRPLCFGA
jgi:hypothetical protein